MSWESHFYGWFLRELIEAIRALELGDQEPEATEGVVTVPRLRGQYSRDANGYQRFTGRESNLIARPGQRVVLTDSHALGDGTRRTAVQLPQPGGAFPAPPLTPTRPRIWREVHSTHDTLLRRVGGAWEPVQIKALANVAQPQLDVVVPGHARRRYATGVGPDWEDWAALISPFAEPQGYSSARVGDRLVQRGLAKPWWDRLTTHGTSGLPLPIEIDPVDSVPVLHRFPYFRSGADATTAVEKGLPLWLAGIGMMYHPLEPIVADLVITPPYVTIWPGGDHTTPSTEFWWQIDPLHEGPVGDELSEEQYVHDAGLQVNMFEGTFGEWVTVEPTTLPVIEIDQLGDVTEVGAAPADRYTFSPPAPAAVDPNREWTFDRTWSWSRDITVQPADWVHSPSISFIHLLPVTLLGAPYSGDTTSFRVSGMETVKTYEASDDKGADDHPWLVKPDPGDDATWYWVDCRIHVGDHLALNDPTVGGYSVLPTFNSAGNADQFAFVTDVQPTDPLAPEANDWTITLRHPVRRLTTSMSINRSLFAMPQRYFGAAGAARTFTVSDEVTARIRPTSILRPSTAAYNAPGYQVETNWTEHVYIGGPPNPREAMLFLLHTIGFEVYFKRVMVVSGAHMTTVTRTQEHTQLYNLAEDNSYDAQEVHMISPGNRAMAMLRGVVRTGWRKPNADDLTAIIDQGYGTGVIEFHRPPLNTDAVYPGRWDCDPPPPVVPFVNVTNEWPHTTYIDSDNGFDNFVRDTDIHPVSGPTPPTPLFSQSVFRRDHALQFDGRVVGHILHPPNVNVLEHAGGAQNPFTRAHFEAVSPTIYTGPLGTLHNPLARTPAQGGGTWCGITIPTRWYDADAIVVGAVTYGVVLCWHEDRIGQADEFTLHTSVIDPLQSLPVRVESPLLYFPHTGAGEVPTTLAGEDFAWPPSGWPKVSPGYEFMSPTWPRTVGQVGPFSFRAFNARSDRAGMHYSDTLEGFPYVVLVID